MDASLSSSPEAMNTSVDPNRRTDAAKNGHFTGGQTTLDTWLSAAVICLMTATMLALFWFPLRRTFANVEVNYNEGWNAYRAAMVASGIPLYGSLPQGFGTATAYPPLSFHLIGLLGTAKTFPLMGRLVSLISLLTTGVFVALVVRRGGGSWQIAVFSFLLYEIGIALLRADRIGMNDPQLLGEALSAAGLYFYVRNPDSNRLLCISALLLCFAGFTKPNLLAFPAAIAIDLLLRSRRAFATWAGAMLVSAGLLTVLTLLIDGRYFLVHLLGGGGRAYSYWIAWSQFHHYAEKFQSMLVIGTAWSVCSFRSHRLFASAFIISHLFGFLLAGGSGVDLNIFFNGLAVTAIACGIALSDLGHASVESRPAVLNPATALMFAFFFLSVMMFVPGQLRRDRAMLRALPAHESEFNSAVEFVKTRPGPSLCESLLLCYEAGKPFEFEPYSVQDMIKTRRLREDEVLQVLRTHRFQTVQIALRSDEEPLKDWIDLRASLSSDQKDPDKERRFTPNFMRELLNDYQLSKRTSDMAIFCPK
jgi:hypothetical protein